MKLIGTVEVSNRVVRTPTEGMLILSCKMRPHRASLSLGKKPGTEELFILHQSTQMKLGSMYKVMNNVERVFNTYAKQGKATIRFKSPPHDLIINADPLSLMGFLNILKAALDRKGSMKKIMFSSLQPTSQVAPKRNSKMVIMTKGDYPVLKGFSRTLESLQINDIEQRRFDKRILCLQSLRILDLTNNCLTSLPDALGAMPQLHTLCLARNLLGKGQPKDWMWMHGNKLSHSLKMLDLSHNELLFVPEHLIKLQTLVTLKVDCNKLKKLPNGIGRLSNLRYLSAHNNELSSLPMSVKFLRLESIDLADNPFQLTTQGSLPEFRVKVPKLLECAARRIINGRLAYGPEDLPANLLFLLDSAQFCYCGSACFEFYSKLQIMLNLHRISRSNTHSMSGEFLVPMEIFICSKKCTSSLPKHNF